MSQRVTKSVYFSLLEPEDVALLEHAIQMNPITNKSRNFSKYVRRLIENDMRGTPSTNPQPIIQNEQKTAMSSFL